MHLFVQKDIKYNKTVKFYMIKVFLYFKQSNFLEKLYVII